VSYSSGVDLYLHAKWHPTQNMQFWQPL
jgi:hypothetical protein